jgi:hypothetical protein
MAVFCCQRKNFRIFFFFSILPLLLSFFHNSCLYSTLILIPYDFFSNYVLLCNSLVGDPDSTDSEVSVFQCQFLASGDLEIAPLKPRGKVWVGVNNLNSAAGKKEDYLTAIIKRVIRSANSYKGGGTYAPFGGYDITLIELTGAVPPKYGRPACLPTPSFKDTAIKADLAGYGQFYRRNMNSEDQQKCQTDEFGRNKFHLCSKDGTGDKICHMDKPAPRTAACSAFFNQTAIPYPEEYEEIQLVDAAGKTVSFCFNTVSPLKSSRGWCETDMNHYGFFGAEEPGWGFCSSDCYLGNIQEDQACDMQKA